MGRLYNLVLLLAPELRSWSAEAQADDEPNGLVKPADQGSNPCRPNFSFLNITGHTGQHPKNHKGLLFRFIVNLAR